MADVIGQDAPAGNGAAEIALDERPRSLADVVYDAIYRAIVTKALAPGEALTEPGMAERLQVSKTPVREAFLRLRQIGLIEGDGPRGLRVVMRSTRKLEQAYELREALEPPMARAFAKRSDADAQERLTEIAAKSVEAARAGDVLTFREADTAFHSLIASTMDNPRVTEANEGARALIATLRARDFPGATALVSCAEEHASIARAVADRKPEKARETMATHIRNTAKLMLASAEQEAVTA